jgi:hypothetical protein
VAVHGCTAMLALVAIAAATKVCNPATSVVHWAAAIALYTVPASGLHADLPLSCPLRPGIVLRNAAWLPYVLPSVASAT